MRWIFSVGIFTFGIVGTFRFAILLADIHWSNALVAKVDEAKSRLSCVEFHNIQSTPRPWYVKVNEWLEDYHL